MIKNSKNYQFYFIGLVVLILIGFVYFIFLYPSSVDKQIRAADGMNPDLQAVNYDNVKFQEVLRSGAIANGLETQYTPPNADGHMTLKVRPIGSTVWIPIDEGDEALHKFYLGDTHGGEAYKLRQQIRNAGIRLRDTFGPNWAKSLKKIDFKFTFRCIGGALQVIQHALQIIRVELYLAEDAKIVKKWIALKSIQGRMADSGVGDPNVFYDKQIKPFLNEILRPIIAKNIELRGMGATGDAAISAWEQKLNDYRKEVVLWKERASGLGEAAEVKAIDYYLELLDKIITEATAPLAA